MTTIKSKKCSRCKKHKSATLFHKDKYKPDGLYHCCKKCNSEAPSWKNCVACRVDKPVSLTDFYKNDDMCKKCRIRRGKKLCGGCSTEKKLTEFRKGSHGGRWQAVCSKCHDMTYKDRHLDGRLRREFGITVEEYKTRVVNQGGVCAVCKKPETNKIKGQVIALAVDHCHTTKNVRGLLCSRCNPGIGYFLDDPALLRAAADYLERTRDATDSRPADSSRAA